MRLSVITPSIAEDTDTLLSNAPIIFKHLPVKNIYAAVPGGVSPKVHDSRIIFVNENEFVDAGRIREMYSLRAEGTRAGWYIQQFVKMQFSRFTNDEYYLVWDSDTIPLKPVDMFADDGRPFFDMKDEMTPAYFRTLGKILPDIHKTVNESFISEHMIIRTEYMREMLAEIEANHALDGRNFQEKIITAIDTGDLAGAGFSEFETYGNYVVLRHPESYTFRTWRSLRDSKKFYGNASELDERNASWLAKRYDAISIEKFQRPTRWAKVIQSPLFQKIFSPRVIEWL